MYPLLVLPVASATAGCACAQSSGRLTHSDPRGPASQGLELPAEHLRRPESPAIAPDVALLIRDEAVEATATITGHASHP